MGELSLAREGGKGEWGVLGVVRREACIGRRRHQIRPRRLRLCCFDLGSGAGLEVTIETLACFRWHCSRG